MSDVQCEACDAGMRRAADGVHYDDARGGRTWGVCQCVVEALRDTQKRGDMRLENRGVSVLQDWVTKLPLREQGTLLTCVRGCDDEPKTWTSRGVAFSQGRRVTAYLRWTFMNPADPREVDFEEGAFFQRTPPYPFKPSEFGHLPQHWYAHVMHALEVVAYRHPKESIRDTCKVLYTVMAHNLHLNVETLAQFDARLSEDRVASGGVVS